MKKVEDDVLIESYNRLGNVWKVGDEVGISGQTVYCRLKKIGVNKNINRFTKEDYKFLKDNYIKYRNDFKLNELAVIMGRTKEFISRKAKELGLTGGKIKVPEWKKEQISISRKKYIKEHGHNRGMLGKHHSEEFKNKMSEQSKKMWNDKNSYMNSEEYRQKLSDRVHIERTSGKGWDSYSKYSIEPVNIEGYFYKFKSRWEYNIAKILQKYKEEKRIMYWIYEPVHFEFKDVKRGIRSYCPDFFVKDIYGDDFYIEVKGRYMPKSLERINMFVERYPEVKLYIIDERNYNEVCKTGNIWANTIKK